MFVGTYIGGSINFNAVALEYGVIDDGLLYAGASVVDSGVTTLWMVATVFLPRLLTRRLSGKVESIATSPAADDTTDVDQDSETVHAFDFAVLLALGALAIWISRRAAAAIETSWEVSIPSILILTTIALAMAQFDAVRRLRGSRVAGWLGVMIFLAVIGALCDIGALSGMGELGARLTVFRSDNRLEFTA